MSYQNVPGSEHLDGEHLDREPEPSSSNNYGVHHREKTPVQRSRFFKSAKATHAAISIAAGTVMCLFGYEQGVFGGIIVGSDFLGEWQLLQ